MWYASLKYLIPTKELLKFEVSRPDAEFFVYCWCKGQLIIHLKKSGSNFAAGIHSYYKNSKNGLPKVP